MKYILSILRMLIGIFGGVIVIIIIASFVLSFTNRPSVQNSTLFGDLYGWSILPLMIKGFGAHFLGSITLFFIILYFIIKKISKEKLNTKNGS